MKKTEQINLLIADDHEIYRDGLKLMFRKQTEIILVGEAENGKQAIELCNKLKPDVVLMDIMMPVMDGIAATKHLSQFQPEIGVIALSMFNEDNLIVDMLEAGAKGFMLKNSDKKEIMEAIRSVYREVPYYCPSTSGKLAQMIARSRFNPFVKVEKKTFSEKEIEIMKLVCMELTNKEIGERLFISPRTVEGHRLKLQEKLKVKSTTGIVIYAIQNGIYKI